MHQVQSYLGNPNVKRDGVIQEWTPDLVDEYSKCMKDPTYFAKIDLNNHQRIIRALEVCISSGKSFSSFLQKKKTDRIFNTKILILEEERNKLTTDFEDMKKNIQKVETDLMQMKNNLNALAGAIQFSNRLVDSAKKQEYDTDKFEEKE